MSKPAAIALLVALFAGTRAPDSRAAGVSRVPAESKSPGPAFQADTLKLVIPLDGASSELARPLFAWRKLADAESYELQISTRADFTTPERSLTGLPDTIHALKDDLQDSTRYFWRVRGRNPAGASGYSAAWTFTTLPPVPKPPFLTEPRGGEGRLAVPVTFSWQKPEFAIQYHLQISMYSDFRTTVLDTFIRNGQTSLVFSRLTYERTYYWRVAAGHQGGRSAYSNTGSFSTLQKPAYVSLRSPSSTINVPVPVNLVWAATPLASSYRIQVSTQRDFSTLAMDTAIADTVLVAQLENKTRYHWQVCALNAAGSSPYTQSEFTTVDLFPPAVPVLASPMDSAEVESSVPVLKWHPAKLAAVYKVQISQSPTFAVLDYQDSAADTTETAGPLKGAQLFYWRVQSLNAAGVSGFSEIRRFRTGSTTARASRGASPAERVSLVSGASGARLEFSVPEAERVRISLIEPGTGRRRVLADGKFAAGTHRIDVGKPAGAAVFLLHISLGGYREIRWVPLP